MDYRSSVLNAVVETVPEGILVVDENREFLKYNQRFIDMWGIPDDVVESGDDQRALESVLDELERPNEFRETVEYFYDHPDEVGRDLIRLSDGRIFERYTAPATDETGTYYGRIWVFEDITHRRRREQQIQRQNARLEKFASVVSHDLRNPLHVATARLEMVQDECDSENLDAASRALDRMEGLIEDLLTLARTGQTAPDLASIDLASFTERCWQNVPTPGATLVTETDRCVRADEDRLRQLFENLFRNSVEHGSTGGRQSPEDDVEAGGPTVTVGDFDGGFYVADDGPGIAPGDRERVFEAGYSTAAEGTGFGLNIVQEVADAHGWDLRIAESESGGARFEITGVEFDR